MPKQGRAEAAPGANTTLCRGHGWSGQELTLQLSAPAKNGEGMEDLCWPFPNIAPFAAILSLRGQRKLYQL